MSKHNNRKNVHWVIIAVLLVIVAMMAVMLLRHPADNGNLLSSDPTEAGINGEEFAETEDPGIAVETPYMTYHYSSDLADTITVKQTSAENRHEAAFLTEINGEELELFRIILGTANVENGYVLGTLEDNTLGDIPVTLVMNEQKAEDWSEEDLAMINALQERINDIIPQISSDSRFTANR